MITKYKYYDTEHVKLLSGQILMMLHTRLIRREKNIIFNGSPFTKNLVVAFIFGYDILRIIIVLNTRDFS